MAQPLVSMGPTVPPLPPVASPAPMASAPVVTLGEAIAETLAVKAKSNLYKPYVNSIRQYLAMFARGRESEPISSITTEVIEAWFAGRNEKPVSRSSNIGRLSSMFQLAWRKRWIQENPCRRLERIRIDRKAPQILSIEQVKSALVFTRNERPRWLAYFALATFAGVRPTELLRVSWACVNLAKGTLTIDAAASKVRRRRIVRLMPAALAWLKLAKEKDAQLGNLTYVGRKRYYFQLRKLFGFQEWPQDILRHTAASYWLAEVRDAAKVACELGNSPGILGRHYLELVEQEQAAAFWAIMPETV